MKTLLLLGGSASQVVAIQKARELGYRTVVCDYLPDNPGQAYADSFYLVSTTDKDAVLEVAKKEHIDGVVAYGSDPAAPTAAYVAEALGLPGIPYDTARSFCEKQRFRLFLESKGFAVPAHCSLGENNLDNLDSYLASMAFPIIIKPSDSSGSKGVSVVRSRESVRDALASAMGHSRSGTIEVEEFLAAKHDGIIEAEIFVYEGRVVSWGLMRCLRDGRTNPLLPAGYRHPLDLSAQDLELVKNGVAALVEAGGIRYGALNMEMIITPNDELFFIDVGPRNGGNMLPYFFSLISGDDLIEGTLRCAMGEPWQHGQFDGAQEGAWYMHVLHACEAGFFDHVDYSDSARAALVFENIFLKLHDPVRPFLTSLDIIGLAVFHFSSPDELDVLLKDPDAHIKVVIHNGR